MRSLSDRLAAVLVIGLVLFTYAEVCGTECAWVLWERSIPETDKDWQINSAYPNYEMCIEARRLIMNPILATWKKTFGDDNIIQSQHGFTVTEKDSAKVKFYYFSKCLPDTIDPRK